VTSGSVLGTAAGRRAGAVHWGVAAEMVVAWLLTLPAAAAFGALAAWVAADGPLGTLLIGIVLVGAAGLIYRLSRRRPVSADTVNDPAPARPAAVPARAAA
jgi:inorganic phosphate transporter, PiT family